MANKTLKSIKFPDLADTYVIPQVDSTLAISGRPADSKSTGDALALKADASALSDYAKTDGLYEDMTVGNAEQLVASVFEEDSTPYLFRTSGGSVDIGDREYDKIVGGTVAWNQLIAVSNGYSETAQYRGMFSNSQVSLINTHKYYLSCLQPSGCRLYAQTKNSFTLTYRVMPAPSANTEQCFIGEASDSITTSLASNIAKSETTETAYQVTNCMLIDLTQMFGSEIADYLYTLESGTAGTGVAKLKSWGFFDKPYYAYNAGELKSVSGLVSHDMTGFNQAEEVHVNNVSAPYDNCLLTKGDLLPNTTYCISFIGANGHKIYNNENLFTTSVHKVCDGTRQYIVATTASVLSEDNANQYNSTYGWRIFKNDVDNAVVPAFTDVCINLSWDGSRDGEYEPYELHSYPLDTDLTLRGIPKLDANNSLYYDGDVYESDGTVTRKYGIVTYDGSSDEVWTLQSINSNNIANFQITISPTPRDETRSGNAITSNGLPLQSTSIANTTTEGLLINGGAILYLRISSSKASTATALKTYLASNPFTLVYELATPTTETADPYQTPQIVNDFGTEEYVVTAQDGFNMPVGHETKYQANLVAKLEMMPNSPSGNGDYIVRQTNGENSYVAITDNSVIDGLLTRCPAASGEDGTYVLKATISDGTVTYAWVAE